MIFGQSVKTHFSGILIKRAFLAYALKTGIAQPTVKKSTLTSIKKGACI